MPTPIIGSYREAIELETFKPTRGGKANSKPQWQQLCSAGFATLTLILATLCLVLGIVVLIVPLSWATDAFDVNATVNDTCPAVTPFTTPFAAVSTPTGMSAFIEAWDAYTNATLTRTAGPTTGVRPGCEPMRFAATTAYRGVAVVYHGFSSCPQEMSHLGPSLAAAGFDTVFPLMAGHGNELHYDEDAPNFLWSYLTMTVSLVALVAVGCIGCGLCNGCARCCACCEEGGCCDQTNRNRGNIVVGALAIVLLIVSFVGLCLVIFGIPNADFCISISAADGIGPGCHGMSEYNDNLPTTRSAYEAAITSINEIVALAPGTHVITGLSGGANAALYAGRTIKEDGSALYARQLFVAPYLDVATIGSLLTPLINLGLGNVKVDWGGDCRINRRGAGKAGYCNYALNRIDAMRSLGRWVLDHLVVPPGASMEILKVAGDPTVTNADITLLAERFASLSSNTSMCVLEHVDSKHSPLSMWNDIHLGTVREWIPELICQVTAYLAHGVPLPVNETTAEGEDVCYSACASGHCSFDCATQSFITCNASGLVRQTL